MVLIVTMMNYFNFSGIMTQLVSVSTNFSFFSFFPDSLGLYLFHRDSWSESKISLRTQLHAIPAPIYLRRGHTVCSLYVAPVVPITRDDLVELLHQLPEPFLLVGDFSICHPILGDTIASPNAAMLLSVTSNFSLCCLNSGLPYYRSTDSFTCLLLFSCP